MTATNRSTLARVAIVALMSLAVMTVAAPSAAAWTIYFNDPVPLEYCEFETGGNGRLPADVDCQPRS